MRKFVSLMTIWFIVNCSFLSFLIIPQGGGKGETVLYVRGTGPGNYSSIQAAINEASNGDTIFVYNGTYYGNILIERTISLIGESKDTTIINGNLTENVVYITADNVSISGFTITNGSYSGLKVESSYVNIIDNNVSKNGGWGIYLNYTGSNSFIGFNDLSENQVYGIFLFGSDGNNITENNISDGHRIGIWVSSSNSNNISYNLISGYDLNPVPNYYNKGIYLEHSSFNNINNNNVIGPGNEGLYFDYSSNNNTVECNNITGNKLSGIKLLFYNKGNTIKNNNIFGNDGYGIIMKWDSSKNFVNNNNISQNLIDGIYLSAGKNYIIGNEISGNQRDGIRINISGKNIINSNKIFENQIYGISVSSENNIIYNNNIINNSIQAYKFDGNNIWNLSHIYGGNYWSDYDGYDNYSGPNQDLFDSDGIGDTPYILGDIIDHFPLMNPVVITNIIPTELKVPKAPQNLQARSGFRYVNLTWEEPDYEPGLNIIEYKIYRSLSIDEEILIDTINYNNLFNDSYVNVGQMYFYKIKAVNVIGESQFSNQVNVVPMTISSVPQNIQIISSYDYINLSWEEPSDLGGSIILNYTIYRGEIPSEVELLKIIDNTTYYNDTEVIEDRTYFYVITAVNEIGEGPQSNEINITTSIAPVIDTDHNFQFVFLLFFLISVVITMIIAYIILTKKSKND